MESQVSICILDVRRSSQFKDQDELMSYLDQVAKQIGDWTKGIVETHVSHRKGDEVIFVSQHYFVAFLIASYLKKFWKYAEHPPYFGITFGLLEKNVSSIYDVERWNSHLVQYARFANEKLKKERRDDWLLFDYKMDALNRSPRNFLLEILNHQVRIHKTLVDQQAKQQKIVYSLYSVFDKQQDIAKYLGKSPSTISTQINNGNCDQIYEIENMIESTLVCLENLDRDSHDDLYEEVIDTKRKQIHNRIKGFLRLNIEKFIPRW